MASEWRRTGGSLRFTVTIPVGSTATVRVPAHGPKAVTERGRALRDAEGVLSVTVEDGVVVVRAGSGRYTFVAER